MAWTLPHYITPPSPRAPYLTLHSNLRPPTSPPFRVRGLLQCFFPRSRNDVALEELSLGLIPRSCTLQFRRWPTEHVLSDHSRTDRVRKIVYSYMQSVGRIYIIWPSCVEGLGGCPTPPQAEPLQNTHLLGVPALAGNHAVAPLPLWLRYASHLIQPRDHTPSQKPTLGSTEGLGYWSG